MTVSFPISLPGWKLLLCDRKGRFPKWDLSRSCWPHRMDRLWPKPTQLFLQPRAMLTASLPLQWATSPFHSQSLRSDRLELTGGPGVEARFWPDPDAELMQDEDTGTHTNPSHRGATADAPLSPQASPCFPWGTLSPRNRGEPCSSGMWETAWGSWGSTSLLETPLPRVKEGGQNSFTDILLKS